MGSAKRERFERTGGGSSKGSVVKWAIGLLLLVLPLALFFARSGQVIKVRPKIAEPMVYKERVEMKAVEAKEDNKYLSIKLEDVMKNRLVSFKYDEKRIPDGSSTKPLSLMAYVTPAGRLFVGTAYCPPCRSDKHFIDKDGTLTCDLCDTKRDLETLKGIKGGCVDYPPDEFNIDISNGMVNIRLSDLDSWSPKPL